MKPSFRGRMIFQNGRGEKREKERERVNSVRYSRTDVTPINQPSRLTSDIIRSGAIDSGLLETRRRDGGAVEEHFLVCARS